MHAQADPERAKWVSARLPEDGFRAAPEDCLPGDIVVRGPLVRTVLRTPEIGIDPRRLAQPST
ncbi:hypothetical protein [Streptosporangium sp. V21-05]|uniref:hypothetical protein n=1 Tax=Streptosporangium sp. V21-05 TaxID=3446115 RepID=UPI003F533ADD